VLNHSTLLRLVSKHADLLLSRIHFVTTSICVFVSLSVCVYKWLFVLGCTCMYSSVLSRVLTTHGEHLVAFSLLHQ